jgi:hypothetical protein
LLQHLEIVFIATNYEVDGDALQNKLNERNLDNAICRFEWLEALVRISMIKFPLQNRISDALDRLMEEHVLKGAKYLLTEQFRKEFVYTEAVDLALTPYISALEDIFSEYSRGKLLHMKKVLDLDNYLSLLGAARLIDNELTRDEACRCFVNSKLTRFQSSLPYNPNH